MAVLICSIIIMCASFWIMIFWLIHKIYQNEATVDALWTILQHIIKICASNEEKEAIVAELKDEIEKVENGVGGGTK